MVIKLKYIREMKKRIKIYELLRLSIIRKMALEFL